MSTRQRTPHLIRWQFDRHRLAPSRQKTRDYGGLQYFYPHLFWGFVLLAIFYLEMYVLSALVVV